MERRVGELIDLPRHGDLGELASHRRDRVAKAEESEVGVAKCRGHRQRHGLHRFRRRGSSVSRIASPTRLKLSTVSVSAMPGAIAIHGAWNRYTRPSPDSMP